VSVSARIPSADGPLGIPFHHMSRTIDRNEPPEAE
jgi:hypothetical protein